MTPPGDPRAKARRYWDARAREDAYHFVDNRLAYGDADADAFWSSGPEALDSILGELGAAIEPGDELVEIGCGVGRLTRALAAAGATVRAVDVSPQMLERARAENPGLTAVEWILGDGETLAPIADASADVCFSHVVFQHIPDPDVTLGYVREMGRVLRPGGWAAFGVSNAPAVHWAPGVGARARAALRALSGRGPHGQSHPAWRGSAVNLDRLTEVAGEAGLEVERVSGAGTQFCYVLARRQAAAAA